MGTERDTASSSRLRILIAESGAQEAHRIIASLRSRAPHSEILHFDRLGPALPHLDDAIDVVLLGLELPDAPELEAVRQVRAIAGDTPIVALAHRRTVALGVEAIRCGAQDYILKDDLRPERLNRALRHAIERQDLLTCLSDSASVDRNRESGLREVIRGHVDALVIVSPEGEIVYVNSAAELLFGRDAQCLVGHAFGYHVAPGVDSEIEIAREDGVTLTAEMRTVEVVWAGATAVLASLRDVTARREAAAGRMQLEMTHEFLSHVSHELRTPLAAVYQFVSNVKDELAGPVTPLQDELLGAALRNVDEVLAMMSNLLEVSRAEAGKMRLEPRGIPLELHARTVTTVLDQTASARGVRLTLHIDQDLPVVLADPGRVRQVLTNLIENAVKFTPEGGRVEVHIGPESDTGSHLRVSVIDTGCGLTPEASSRVFDRLYQAPDDVQRSRRGLGLGLYICRELVVRQGGRIWVESEPGRGSAFHFTLPVHSLASLVGPFIERAATGGDPLWLLTVELDWSEPSTDEPIPDAIVRNAQMVIRREVKDVDHLLLPRMEHEEPREQLTLIITTRRAEVEGVRRRLESALMGNRAIRESALTVAVDVHDVMPQEFDGALSQCEDALRRAISERCIAYEVARQ